MMAGSQSLDPRTARSRPYELSGKEKAITAAKEMQAIVDQEVKKSSIADPQYEFLELIGKGAFGRVYKSLADGDHHSKHVPSNRVVAIKIIDIDAADYSSKGEDTAKDVLRETGALRALKESNAKNINVIYDAFFLASYVWIVSEYCPGGSVHTLMRASPEPGLSEAYIIPIAREVAEALKWVHNAGIIHRDVKAANILVSEDGRVQLCDFGVAGVLESKINKRTTILGTPHYMAPEMLDVIESNRIIHYGNEIDIWAFGCTLYELATGLPPNARVSHEHLRFVVRDQAPRLEGTKYSPGLREFVEFCIEASPRNRPSIEQVQNHYYILNTSRNYPTSSLKRLLYDYYVWERSGGQRASLFMPGGAPIPELSKDQDEDEWNFSTTEVFDKSFAEDQSTRQLGLLGSTSIRDFQPEGQESQASQSSESHRRIPLQPLERLFIADDTYNYLERGQQAHAMSDLPLREQNENSSRRETVIDAGAFDASTGIATIPDMSTVRGNKKFGRFLRDSDDESETVKFHESDEGAGRRATKDWKFPTLAVSTEEGEARRKTQDWKFPTMVPAAAEGPTSAFKVTETRPALVHSATEPVGSSFQSYSTHDDSALTTSAHSIIDLDDYAASPTYAGPGPDIVSYDQSAFEPFGIDTGSTVHGSFSHQRSGSEGTTVDTTQGILSNVTAHVEDPTAKEPAIPEVLLPSRSLDHAKGFDFQPNLSREEQFEQARERFHEQQEQAWKDNPLFNPKSMFVDYGDLTQDQDWVDYHSDNYEHYSDDEPDPSRRPQTRWGDADFPTMHRGEGGLHPINDPFDPAYGLSLRHRLEGFPGPATTRRVDRTASIASKDDNLDQEEGYYEDDYEPNPFQLGPMPAPPSAEALAEGAPPEILEGELERPLTDFMGTMGTLRRGLEASLTRDQRRAAKKDAAKIAKKAKKAADKLKREEKAAEAAEKAKEKAKAAEMEKGSKGKGKAKSQDEKVGGVSLGVGVAEAGEGGSNTGGQTETKSGEE